MTKPESASKPLQIGVSVPRADGWSKITGRERYAADYYGPDFLWAGVKRADMSHALLRELDVEAAKAVPGVTAVLTHRDVKGSNRQGVVFKNQPVLVDKKVRRRGDALALVLAENREVLSTALKAVHVRLEPLPPVFSVEEATMEGAPKVHEEHPTGNILAELTVSKGNGKDGIDECTAVVEAEFELPRQEHAYMETEAGWAYLEHDGRLVIVASTQSPFRDRSEVAEALGIDIGKVRITAPYLGGGFGGKDGCTVQSLLGLAAMHSHGRPVKMWWDREESFLAGVKRLSGRVRYRVGTNKDGCLHALQCELDLDNGPYEHLGGEVLALAVEHAGGPYRIPHVWIHGRCVYTNNPAGGPFRGFGAPQVVAGLEQVVDMLADRLNMDPVLFRMRNAVIRGDRNPVGVTLTQSTGLLECLEQVTRHPLWTERREWKRRAGAFKKRGVGVACTTHGAGYGPIIPDFAQALIKLTPEGRITVTCGVPDMGQGNAATFVQIAGHLLNQSADRLDLVLPDTDHTLPSCSSAASRTTYTYARALTGAAELLKKRILEQASLLMMAPSPDEFRLLPGMVRHLPSGKDLPLAMVARTMSPSQRECTYHWRAPVCREPVRMESVSTVFGMPHLLFSYAAHLACVEVDELTGRVQVLKYLAATDAGSVINPQLYEQQVQGGIVQGLGYGLYEDYVVDRGEGQTPDFATYILPTSMDVPDMESLRVETFEETGPFGLKGVGEICINAPLPAVANALADAAGVRISRIPMTPERVLDALSRIQSEKTS